LKIQIDTIVFRPAEHRDLGTLVAMLADDALGATREDASLPLHQGYEAAFAAVQADPNNELIVLAQAEQLVAMMQLSFIPYLSYKGSWRCMIESVRVRTDCRGQGLGEHTMRWAMERARQRDCHLLQLTSDKQRPKALEFYQRLGFVATHEGFKLRL